MSTQFHWFIPSGGDGRHLVNTAVRSVRGGSRGTRAPEVDYLVQVARVAESAGFDGVMLPVGSYAQDGWLLAAAMSAETRHLRFLVSLRPGLELPTAQAQKAATLQQLSGGRLELNVVAGSAAQEQRAYGDFLDHDQRYERAEEFVHLVRAVWRGRPLQHAGRYYMADVGRLGAAVTDPAPPIYFGGASEIAERVSVAQADVHALWGETPPMVAERLERLRRLTAAQGRPPLGFALRIHVIARPTAEAAWAEADRLLRPLSQEVIDLAQRQLARSESVGQARMRALHQGRRVTDALSLEVYPNIWAGVGLVRGGAGTAIVGSYAQVAERMAEYRALGVTAFLLSGYPNLEEARVVGAHVLPLLRPRAAPAA
ncbi:MULTISPECIES: LLM class flavin-dependent oxidoreductase [unclassified Variovorax]|uniref:LLM class flavin-dependent oxidoreductase n=1 Tax=unclassified Variovorax TaxID=663243 RepID=UPI0025780D7F|nr:MULTISPECIES: LLM class flavin-dependent oxidoreductase [unclassified Variovorax]MDM0087165.1 LLM class flavin-dependent oxidoreductase [Variovorax sp. J22G40]MDM0144578.1 LLM class flavin-dependent oxidoreductase [Variovorax sp. J2P1-31]